MADFGRRREAKTTVGDLVQWILVWPGDFAGVWPIRRAIIVARNAARLQAAGPKMTINDEKIVVARKKSAIWR